MTRIIKRERVFTHDGYSVRNEYETLDRFFPIVKDINGNELVSTELIAFIASIRTLGITMEIAF